MLPTVYFNDISERDRALMGALITHEQSIHSCGQPAHESFDPDGPDYNLEDSFCRACAILAQQDTSNDEPGTVWSLEVRRP